MAGRYGSGGCPYGWRGKRAEPDHGSTLHPRRTVSCMTTRFPRGRRPRLGTLGFAPSSGYILGSAPPRVDTAVAVFRMHPCATVGGAEDAVAQRLEPGK